MQFKCWKDLSDEEKNIRLRRICGGAAIVFVIVMLLLLMKCEGCSSASHRKNGRNFYDGKGHSYGEEFSGADLFDNEYGKGVEDYSLLDSDSNSDSDLEKAAREAEAKAAREAEAKAAREAETKAAEKKAAEKKAAAERKAEAERKAAEEKKRKADEKARLAAEEKARKEAAQKEGCRNSKAKSRGRKAA